MTIKNLYRVDLGEPDGGATYSSYRKDKSIKASYFCVANSYDEAASKVLDYVGEIKQAQQVIDANGDLRGDLDDEVRVKGVILYTDELIFS